jgi:cytochrome P450
MALHPEAQAKAQAEIDAAVGQDRLPEFSDRPNMPYVNALLLEVFRWRTITPVALPHMPIEDEVYNGYFIPAGTIIMANTWSGICVV